MIQIFTDVVAFLNTYWIIITMVSLLVIAVCAAILAIQDGNRKAARDYKNRQKGE